MITEISPLEYLEKIREGEIRIIRLVCINVHSQFGEKKWREKNSVIRRIKIIDVVLLLLEGINE